MGSAPRVLPGWMLNARRERNEEMLKGYYTVALDRPGFPVYFLCPHCLNIHSYPEIPEEANFQDPGEASQSFKANMKSIAEWKYVSPAILVIMIVVVKE